MKQKLLATLLAFCLVVGMLPLAASAAEGDVAQVEGGSAFSTLADAIDAVPEGGTITLIDSFVLYNKITIQNKTFTLNMNGKKKDMGATNSDGGALIFSTDSNVTINGNGSVGIDDSYLGEDAISTGISTGRMFETESNAVLTIENGKYYGGLVCVLADGDSQVFVKGGQYSVMDDYGGRIWVLNRQDRSNSRFFVTGGTFTDFNPYNSETEDPVENFCAEGYATSSEVVDGHTIYTVVPPVAQVEGNYYESLHEAINAANSGGVITLLRNTAEPDISVPSTQKITLDLNGNTLDLGVSTLEVEGDLIIQDSTATAEPVVSADYETITYEAGKILYTGSGTAIVPKNGGTVTLKSGIVDASAGGTGIYASGNCHPENAGDTTEVHSTVTVEGGYVHTREYGIGVQGRGATANISGGVIATVDNAAVAGNGTSNDKEYLGGTTINISGGTMIGHITTSGYIAVGIYHPQNGALNISGGTIYADNGVGICIRNGSLDISGDAKIIATGNEAGKVGDAANQIPGKSVVIDYSSGYNHGNSSVDSRKVNIEGGYFSAEQENVDVYTTNGNKEIENFISAGYFTSDPSQYLKEGKAAVESDKAGYNYMVADATKTPAEVVPAAPKTNVTLGLTEENQKVAEQIQKDLTSEVVTGDGVTAAANSVANQNTVTATEEVLKELNKAIGGNTATDENTKIVVQPYMEITIEDVDVQDQTVTLDITPMYRTVATTAKLEEDEPIVLMETDESEPVNAVQIGKAKPLNITKPVTMTLKLPGDFAKKPVYIQHKWYEYSATADDQGKITFTNPHGFSSFTFTTESQAAAKIDGTTYTSLQEAVNHVENGQTIILLKNGTATVDREVSFTIGNESSTTFKATLTPGSDYTMTQGENGEYTFTKKPSTPVTPGPGDDDEDEFPFTDVKSGAWYYDAVKYVYENGLMAGTSDTTFDAEMKPNRALAAQILYNLEGKPAVTEAATFTDAAAAGEWALDAIAWAQQTGVVAGMGDNLFAPDAQVTREQFAQMMYNYAKYKGYVLTATGDLTQFSDSSKLQSWAVTAMKWANGNGLINGFEDDTIQPAGTTIRGQAASIIMNFDKNVAE